METHEDAPKVANLQSFEDLVESTNQLLFRLHLYRAANSAVAGNPLGTDLHLLWEN